METRLLTTHSSLRSSMYDHLKISPILAPLLESRVGTNYHHLHNFLYSSFTSGMSPFSLPHMSLTVEHLLDGIKNHKTFYVLGDKDADGISSISILVNYLKKSKCQVHYNMPLKNETYGVSERILADIKAKKHEIHTVITVDMGIKEYAFSCQLKEWGIPLVVTDHHTPTESLPLTPFIINPHLMEEHKFVPLCGAALALKLVQALVLSQSSYYQIYQDVIVVYYSPSQECWFYSSSLPHIFSPFQKQYSCHKGGESDFFCALSQSKTLLCNKQTYKYLKEVYTDLGPQTRLFLEDFPNPANHPPAFSTIYPTYSLLSFVQESLQNHHLQMESQLSLAIQYAGIATLCDRVSLHHPENRGLVKTAFQLFQKERNYPLISVISEFPKTLEDFTLHIVPMRLGPLLNAGGRLGKADILVDFLCGREDLSKSRENILSLNRERQKKQSIGLQEVESFLSLSSSVVENQNYLLYASENIHKGVTGVIANKICKTIQKPVIILSIDSELDRIVGSVRSPFPIYSFLREREDLFLAFGGHAKACGFTLSKDKLSDLENYLSTIPWIEVSYQQEEDSAQEIYTIPVQALNLDFFQSIKLLPPYGEGNPPPLFQIQYPCALESPLVFGKKSNHLKWRHPLQKNSEFIFWSALEKAPLSTYTELVSPTIIFEVFPSTFRSNHYDLIVKDIL